jgi:NADH dehydrogenase/NADH:ubiquinone oxidoreductase subunit G
LETNIMKKYLIPTVALLLVLVVAWTAFGQADERPRQRGNRERMQNMSEEEREQFRAQMRERFANMSEEERAQMRQRGGPRGGAFMMGGQSQDEAIKAIEAQLAKLKAAQFTRPQGGYQDLSQDERAKLRKNITKTFQTRQQALQTIIAQVAALQGRRQPAAGAGAGQFMIINTGDLKPIQEAAVKEKATETTQLLERLIARGSGRGFGGRGGRGPGAGQRPQGGQRGGRQRPEGGQGGQRQQRIR